jgi:hypothetical protein
MAERKDQTGDRWCSPIPTQPEGHDMDTYSTFSRSPDGPYQRSVILTPALGEVEPTTAIFVNAHGLLTMLLANDTEPTKMYFDYAARGLYKLRVKHVVSFTLGIGEGAPDQFDNDDIPAVVGLY